MAKGNNGNYLQHCIEIEAATHLAQTDADGRLHIALTHGMKPFENLDSPNGACHSFLYDALDEACREACQCDERKIVKAYREAGASRESYPNTAELLRATIGADKLSGGITERCCKKHEALKERWSGSNVCVSSSSWRHQLKPGDSLACPDGLNAPWLFSMDPMTYIENGCKDDDKLYRSDIDLLECALTRYFDSGQPGFACFFVYRMGTQQENPQRQFWTFLDDLASRLAARSCSYWVPHIGGNINLAGLLCSDTALSFGFVPRGLKPGRKACL